MLLQRKAFSILRDGEGFFHSVMPVRETGVPVTCAADFCFAKYDSALPGQSVCRARRWKDHPWELRRKGPLPSAKRGYAGRTAGDTAYFLEFCLSRILFS